MKINSNYLDRFIHTKNGFLYPIKKGSYLVFDLETLEYIEIITYTLTSKYIDMEGCKILEELYSKSILI